MTGGHGSASPGGAQPLGVARRWWRVAFVVYAVALHAMTHAPGVRTPGMDLARTDLAAHLGAFAVWTALFHAAGLAGPWLEWRAVARAVAVGALAGAADELSQSVPGFNRVVDPADAVANTLGALLAGVVLLVVARVARARGG
ncbi:MAG: hypothetical protein C0475_06070 [Planctomyces sp.]|nr:hypothetical protein [Planctomyces sp.]MBA4039474.1 hypothetical protein [Planctomyces sp.]MBA4120262.1 hypothetical protein [Isosphaera sp.]